MFKNLFNFGYKRNLKEAIGFYLAFSFLCILLYSLIGGLSLIGIGFVTGKSYTFKEGYAIGLKIGYLSNIIFILTICGLLLTKKRLWSSFGCVILGLMSCLASVIGGSMLALIPLAFITTRPSRV